MLSKALTTAAAGNAGGVETDEYFNQTTLLLHGDGSQGANNVSNPGPPAYVAFEDGSDNDFPITVNGDAYGTPFSPYNTSWSNYFDGSGDYLTITDASAFDATGDFTIEFWVNPSQLNQVAGATVLFNGDGAKMQINTLASGTKIEFYPDGVTAIISVNYTGYLNLNSWNHIVFGRGGSTNALWVNGTRLGTATNSTSYNLAYVMLGKQDSANNHYLDGYMSNFRFVKGTDVYGVGNSTISVPTAPLTAVSGTELLTCQSNRFVDNSSNGFTITPAGNVAVKAFSPFAETDTTTGSGYFDGVNGALVTTLTGAAPGTGNFTYEFWFYLPFGTTSTYGYDLLTTRSGDTTDGITCNTTDNGTMYVGYQNENFIVAGSAKKNSWNHIALVRNSGTITAYLNGVSIGTAAKSDNFTSTSFNLGNWNVGLAPGFPGYIADFRYTRSAIYTSNFTPPTSPATEDANTELLTCQYRGTVRNVGFIDSSPNKFLITRNGNTTQGTFSPFSNADGEWSNYFDGSGDYITFTKQTTASSFTCECWFYRGEDVSVYHIIFSGSDLGSANANNTQLRISNAGAVQLVIGGTIVIPASGTAVIKNQWNHIAWVRSGTSCAIFVNGVRQGTGTSSAALNVVSIGTYLGGGYHPRGYISNARITTTAEYDPSLTTCSVPTAPLTAVTGTYLLTCQSNRFVDNSASPLTLTINGNPSIQPFSPFAPSAAYSASVNGGSGYWDGTDTLTVSSTGLTFTGDFTVEAWIYSSFTGGTGLSGFTIIDTRSGYTLTNWAFGIFDSVGTLYWASTGILPASSITCTPNAWNHVLVSRSGTTLRIFVNGQQGYSGTVSGTITPGSATAYIGTGTGGTNYAAPGYISGLSVIDGTATQTSAFTPPTAPPNPTGTELCLNFTNAGILDNTAKNNLETVGNAQVDTSVVKYGTGSLKFDGTGDVLSIPYSNTFSFRTGDFTVEFWINKNNSNNGFIMNCGENTSVGNWALILSSGNLYWQSRYNVTNLYFRSASSILDGNWHHVAITRSSGVQRMFFDGVIQGATVADTTDYVVTSGARIAIGLNNLSANFDDFRITKGVARYTTTFTPSDKAFPDQ